MEFTAGNTYEVTGFAETVDHDKKKKLAFMGLSPGGYFKVMHADADKLTIETSLVKMTLSREALEPLNIEKR